MRSIQDLSHTRFEGASALIFGGGKGIGRGVAREWARRGAQLVIADIDQAAAAEAAELIAQAGGMALALRADVLSDQSVAETVAAAEKAPGPLDIVMSNVGGMLNGHPEDIPFAEWQRMMDVNYFAAVRDRRGAAQDARARARPHRQHRIVRRALPLRRQPGALCRGQGGGDRAEPVAGDLRRAAWSAGQLPDPGPVLTGVMDSMTSWSADCPLRGPGSELELKTVEEVATRLADGIEAGEILIPSDEQAWTIIRRWADGPDAFNRGKIVAFAGGDDGRPQVPAALMGAMERPQ